MIDVVDKKLFSSFWTFFVRETIFSKHWWRRQLLVLILILLPIITIQDSSKQDFYSVLIYCFLLFYISILEPTFDMLVLWNSTYQINEKEGLLIYKKFIVYKTKVFKIFINDIHTITEDLMHDLVTFWAYTGFQKIGVSIKDYHLRGNQNQSAKKIVSLNKSIVLKRFKDEGFNI